MLKHNVIDMAEDSEYHAYICMDQGCTARCVSFTRDDGNMTHDEKPCHCLFGGAEVEWCRIEDYIDEMMKLKKALNAASDSINKIEGLPGMIK